MNSFPHRILVTPRCAVSSRPDIQREAFVGKKQENEKEIWEIGSK
jgi:hypothetical protein